jgi:hypothetical protein
MVGMQSQMRPKFGRGLQDFPIIIKEAIHLLIKSLETIFKGQDSSMMLPIRNPRTLIRGAGSGFFTPYELRFMVAVENGSNSNSARSHSQKHTLKSTHSKQAHTHQ